jgi:PmbA protein
MQEHNDVQEMINNAIQIALSSGAKEVIAKYTNRINNQIRISNSCIDILNSWRSFNLELFLAIGRRIDVLTIQDPTIEKMRLVIPEALKHIPQLPKSLLYWGMAKKHYPFHPIPELFDANITTFTDKAPDLMHQAIQTALDGGAKKVAGVIYFGHGTTGLMTSYGNGGIFNESYYRSTIRAFVDGQASGQDIITGRSLNNIETKIDQMATNAANIAVKATGGVQGKPGVYDVILSPTVAANIFGEMTNGANPIYMVAGMSALTKSLGKQIAPSTFSVADSGRIPEGLNSQPCDAEGIPTQETPLIENGVLKNLIHNTSTAKLWSLLKFYKGRRYQSTGNSHLGTVIPDMDYGPKILVPMPMNLVYSTGDSSVEEIIATSQRPTIYITSNWYTRFTNYQEGSFSTIPRDGLFLIENGKIKQPIRNLRLSESLLGMLNRIVAIGNDRQQIQWWEVNNPTFIPHLKIEQCIFTGATQ